MFALIVDPNHGATESDIMAMANALLGGSAVKTWINDQRSIAVAAGSTGILPEDVNDRQPFVDRDLVFIAQARIDNRDEILSRLAVPRPQWSTMADSEVLYLAYRRWGEECVQELAGDYAFAAIHRDSGRTVLSTDHIGSERLYYAQCGSALIASTQLGSLLACSRVPKDLDFTLLGLLAAPKLVAGTTPYKHARALIGGHHLVCKGGTVDARQWWRPDTTIRTRYRDPRDYVQHAKEVFDHAVADRLRAVGGVSTQMSGGLDSTLVSAVAASQLRTRGQTITAYTAIPEPGMPCSARPNWETNDWDYAAEVAALHDNIIHVPVTPGGRCTLDVAPEFHARSRTPARNGCNFLWIGEIASRSNKAGARVVLSGEKGNATLSYTGEGALRDLFWSGRWGALIEFLRHVSEGGLGSSARTLIRELSGGKLRNLVARRGGRAPTEERWGKNNYTRAFLDAQENGLLIPTQVLTNRETMCRFVMGPAKIWSPDPLPQWGVETRDPTGDRRLIECLLTFSREAFLAGGHARGLAREMGAGIVPERVRLRTTRGAQMSELGGIITAHASTYRAVLEQAATLPPYKSMFDIAKLQASLERIVAGSTTMIEDLAMDRAAEVGLFMTEALQ